MADAKQSLDCFDPGDDDEDDLPVETDRTEIVSKEAVPEEADDE